MTKEDFERDRKSIKNITTETHEAWVCEWGILARDRWPLYIDALDAAQDISLDQFIDGESPCH